MRINSRWIRDPNLKNKIVYTIQENVCNSSFTHGKGFLTGPQNTDAGLP